MKGSRLSTPSPMWQGKNKSPTFRVFGFKHPIEALSLIGQKVGSHVVGLRCHRNLCKVLGFEPEIGKQPDRLFRLELLAATQKLCPRFLCNIGLARRWLGVLEGSELSQSDATPFQGIEDCVVVFVKGPSVQVERDGE